MNPEQHLKAEDLDVEGACFGIKFHPGGAPDGLCDLYIEDDETWHYKCTFNHSGWSICRKSSVTQGSS